MEEVPIAESNPMEATRSRRNPKPTSNRRNSYPNSSRISVTEEADSIEQPLTEEAI